MKWETVASTIGQPAFALWNNGRKLITLVFNPSSNAARIEYKNERRVFLIRQEGFLKNRTVLCNEYGVRIGHMGTENNERFFKLNNERFFYSLESSSEPSITIYKESKENPLAVCKMDSPATGVIQDKERSNMLMMLCWYLFQPVQQEAALKYSL
jgi:hypothetical protein